MTTNHDLAKQIEDLIRQHVDAIRTAAATAVTRAFATEPRAARAIGPAKSARPRKKATPRRTPQELVALGERFYAVLCQQPGETMSVLAPQIGVAAGVLHVAVARLRRTGQVRAIGTRQQTRYYPRMASASAPATSSPTVVAA